MWGISYWVVPIFSAFVWLAMLLAMLITWITEGSPRYASMEPGQHIAYISDVGAQGLKPLFIAMSVVTVVTFDLSFILERWLRHTGRLTHNTSLTQKILSFISIIAAIVGAAGLILLSIFDTLRHPRLHDIFLCLFIGGYIVSAIFICAEYQRLGIHYREHSVLRISFWLKLTFILVELALAIAFGVTSKNGHRNVAAVLEWIIALIYFFFVLSFFIDFMPAVRTKHHQSHETEMDVALEQGDSPTGRLYQDSASNGGMNGYTNGANGYTNGSNGYTNGANGYAPGNIKPLEPVVPSRNF
ncbi:SFK1-like membrane protein [Lophium mytilinum]|uniref:SFK1-like membrane protein n=1 Tax=Lophium mytilinum TaxID=390894 RepID=A0A6A6R4H1_9PEZI|nr:SFK1-like membrane protein [Lophium mytilinum]